MASDHAAATTRLDAVRALLTTAQGMVADLATDPQLGRLLRAFLALPEADREAVLGVLERDATWVRIVGQTADVTGIAVRPNPHASLYVHVFDPVTGTPVEPAPLQRDVDVMRLGVERVAALLPLLFQEGVHAQWAPAARAAAHAADPAGRAAATRLAREILALVAEADSQPID